MTSKNSFWASIKENNKRRIWLWLLSLLTYIIAFPTAVAMDISRGKSNGGYLIESLGETLGREALYQDLISRMKMCFGVENYFLLAVAAVFAVVSAIQGFSYLYSKRKIDFYVGMPVKRSRRFLTIWQSGVMIYLLPSLAGTLLGLLIAAGNGLMTTEILKESILAFGLMLCVYLGVYHLTILSVMLTGNVIITCFGTAVFFLYEFAVRILITGYQDMFYKTFVYQDDMVIPLLSPFAIYAKYVMKYKEGIANGLLTAVSLLGFAAVVGFAAYVCYLKRPGEAAGKALAFKAPQPFIKIMIAIPVTLLAGYVVADVVGFDPLRGQGGIGFVLFSMVIVLLVICCLIQVIYEFDIKGIFHRKRHILICAVVVSTVFLIFKEDVFGYDSYIPKVEEVTSAALITPYEYSYYGDNYFDENLEYVGKDDFIMEHMYLTDIGAVNKLLKTSNDTIAACDDLSRLYYDGTNEQWYNMVVVYRMGAKRTVSRRIYVNLDDPQTMELLDRIGSSEEFIDGAFISAVETLDNILAKDTDKVTVYYGSNIYYQKITKEEASELLALYREDIREYRLSDMRNSIPTGSLRLSVERKNSNYTSYRESEIRIYPFYTRCVEYLKEKGIYMDGFLKAEDVEKIQVTNYNYERQKQAQSDMSVAEAYDVDAALVMGREKEYIADTSEYIKNAVYDQEEDIKKLCDKLYPSEWICPGWSMEAETENDYSVYVYFKPGKSVDGMSIGNFSFLKGDTPEFVKEDTVYKK